MEYCSLQISNAQIFKTYKDEIKFNNYGIVDSGLVDKIDRVMYEPFGQIRGIGKGTTETGPLVYLKCIISQQNR